MGRPKREINLEEKDIINILDLYSEGASDVEIKAYLIKKYNTFSQDLWERLLIDNDIFSITIKKGRTLAQSWWEEKGRKNIKDKDFNSTLWYMNMKNRYGWSDNRNVDESKTIQIPNLTIKYESSTT